MRSELENAVISPQAAVAWPKEGVKGMLAIGISAGHPAAGRARRQELRSLQVLPVTPEG
jgi:hypothetical protein